MIYLYMRPGLKEFIDSVSPYYEIILFNSGSSKFTDLLMDSLFSFLQIEKESQTVFSYILNQKNASFNERGHSIKNINLITGGDSMRKLEDCIIIANNLLSFQKHITNGLLISKYQGEREDQTLSILSKYLISNFGSNIALDVRKRIA